jgi:hypothetical protein
MKQVTLAAFTILLLVTAVMGLMLTSSGATSASAQRFSTRTPISPPARTVQPPGTPERDTPDYAATAGAIRTQTSADVTALQSTADARATAIATALADAGLSDTQAAILDALQGRAEVSYNPETGALSLTLLVWEDEINALIDATVAGSGYSPEQVSADLVPGGVVLTIADAVQQGNRSLTLVVTASIAAVDGRLDVTVVSVTVGGVAVPVDQYSGMTDSVEAMASEQIFAALAAAGVDLDDVDEVDTSVDYSVDAVVIGEDSLTLFVTVMAAAP